MQKIYLSDAGPKVSPAVSGFYRWNNITNITATMEEIVNLCLDLGINTFDHGDSYGSYHCEEAFGELLAKNKIRRQDVVLFTKCGLKSVSSNQPEVRINHYNSSAEHIVKSVEASLIKLKTDYIDIFLLDHLDPISDLEKTAQALENLHKSGKIKNFGVANFSVFQHQLLATYLSLPIVTNHIELNLLNSEALDNGQLDYIKQRYMRPMASSPLAAGRIATGTDEQATRVREKLEQIAGKYQADFESLAIAWLIKLGALPLIGTTDTQRIRKITKAFDIELDHQDWYDLYNTSRGI